MAKIRYRRLPEASLIDLSDEELRVLDLALADYHDKLRKESETLHRLYIIVAENLHKQVLVIKRGEELEELDELSD
jgi:hypothetical protein